MATEAEARWRDAHERATRLFYPDRPFLGGLRGVNILIGTWDAGHCERCDTVNFIPSIPQVSSAT